MNSGRILIITICIIFFISCQKNVTKADNEKSIIGRVIDLASGDVLTASVVKITNADNAYQTTTGSNGEFGFDDINNGTYLLTTETSQNGIAIIDTCGEYSTEIVDWGNIYSKVFASVFGIINLEGVEDHSLIDVKLLGTDKSSLTTNLGKFRIDYIFPDTYDLYITKNNYKEIKILNIEIGKGDTISVDTTLSLRFKPMTLSSETGLDLFKSKKAGFCFADNDFWYTNDSGLVRYDVEVESDEQVFVLQNPPSCSGIHYLGAPFLAYDYEDGIWLCGDEPEVGYHRKYSISQSKIVDSIRVNSLPSHSFYHLTCDPLSKKLVFYNTYTNFYPVIYKFDNETREVESVNLNLEEYDFDEYKKINIYDMFIDPNGKVYFELYLVDLNDKWEKHLYICDDLENLKLEKIYKFTDTYKFSNRISYYDGNLFSVHNNDFYKYILD